MAKKLNSAVGNLVSFGGLSQQHLAYAAFPVVLCAFISLFGLFDLSVAVALITFMAVCGLGLVATKPDNFLAQSRLLHPRSNFEVVGQKLREGSKYKREPPRKKITIKEQYNFGNRRKRPDRILSAFEDESDLQTVCDIEGVGAYLLESDRGGSCCVFAWKLPGIDPAITLEDAKTFTNNCDEGLRPLPEGAYLTFTQHAFSWDRSEIERLQDLKRPESTALELLLIDSKCQEIDRLNQAGQRQVKTLYAVLQVPCATTANNGLLGQLIEKAIFGFKELVNSPLGQWLQPIAKTLKENPNRLKRAILNAYRYGAKPMEGSLINIFGEEVKALNPKQLGRLDYLELHQTSEQFYWPQIIMIRGQRVQIGRVPTIHHNNYFLMQGEGQGCAPIEMERYVYLPVRNKYVGYFYLNKTDFAFDDQQWPLQRLHFLTRLMETAELANYKIHTQFGGTNKAWEMFKAQRKGRGQRRTVEDKARRRESAVQTEDKINASDDAILALSHGQTVLTTGCLIAVYADHIDDIERQLHTLKTKTGAVTPGDRLEYLSYPHWRQCQMWAAQPLLKAPFDRSFKLLSQESTTYIPATIPEEFDSAGVQFLAHGSQSPIYFDLVNDPTHMAIVAETRAGKSVVGADFIVDVLINGLPAVIFDFPTSDGDSTYTDLLQLLKRLGAKVDYYDVSRECRNFLAIADYRNVDEPERKRAKAIDFHKRCIALLVLGDDPDSAERKDVNTYINLSHSDFIQDPDIQERYQRAWDGGWGSDAYNDMPTLVTFLEYYKQWTQRYRQEHPTEIDDRVERALNLIARELRSALADEQLRRSIASPSTINPDADIIVIALTEIQDPIKAGLYAMSGYATVLDMVARHSSCVFFCDELPELAKRPAIPETLAMLCSTGLKSGIRVVLMGQEIGCIVKDPRNADQILSNIDRVIVGSVQKAAIPALVHTGIPAERLEPYLTKDKKMNKQLKRSYWLLKRKNQLVDAYWPASDALLAITANNRPEQEARERVLARFPDDPVAGLKEFISLYIRAVAEGLSMASIQ